MDANYPGVPHHQRITSIANDVSESRYEKEYAEFFRKKKEEAAQWVFEWDDKVMKLEDRVSCFFSFPYCSSTNGAPLLYAATLSPATGLEIVD